ncbi:hypothetical protein CA54_08540 [Symmachiella macrocystis]|uniref:Uncharacterized protein n=1 Tax=Symmachiella macrocystis TaxID=2527985 RepID=A0A5C6BJ08_9PLAN|nr:hypothetical protein CA54_08540 [Symmachiella macrocystis]
MGRSLRRIEVDCCDDTFLSNANSKLHLEKRLQTDDRIRDFETVRVCITGDILVSWQRAIDREA